MVKGRLTLRPKILTVAKKELTKKRPLSSAAVMLYQARVRVLSVFRAMDLIRQVAGRPEKILPKLQLYIIDSDKGRVPLHLRVTGP